MNNGHIKDRPLANPDADPDCVYCYGTGERYWHSADCDSDQCALMGGYHDCIGQIEPCPCVKLSTRRER